MDRKMNPLVIGFNVLTLFSTLYYGKHAIFLHAIFVTYSLMSIIFDINDVFKRLKVPLKKYRNMILCFSVFNFIIPIFISCRFSIHLYILYAYVSFCFLLHILHMHYVTLVFRLMNYKDRKHWILLLMVNVLDIFTNLCIFCEYRTYVLFAIMTECLCTYVLLYVRKRTRLCNQRFIYVTSVTQGQQVNNNNQRVVIYNTVSARNSI